MLFRSSKASVNKAISTLREAGYVEQTRYGRVMLTEEGASYAADVWRCHRMLRTFLEHDLGVEPETADAEACLMEHALSHDTMVRWMVLGQVGSLSSQELVWRLTLQGPARH